MAEYDQKDYPGGYVLGDYQNDTPYARELEKAYNEIDQMRMPLINIRRTSNLAVTPLNFFAMGAGIFMFACPMMRWCDLKSPTLSMALAFGGVCNYILGILDWYQGRTLLSFNDFFFAFIHLAFYKSFSLTIYGITSPWYDDGSKHYNANSVGTFFALALFSFIILIICSLKKGIIYIINYVLLALGTIFIMVWQYNTKAALSKKHWAQKTGGYFLFFSSLCCFFIGLGKLLNEAFQNDILPVVEPSI